MPGTRSDELTHDICLFLSLTPFLYIDQIMTTWIVLLFRKSRLYPSTALASGTTTFSIRLNVIRGPFHCYVDSRNGRGGGIDRFWGGSIKGGDRYEGRFCVYGSRWLWKGLRVRRLYFLLFPPCCVFALLTNSSIGRHSSVLVHFNPPASHSLEITLSAHPVFLWQFAILAPCSP